MLSVDNSLIIEHFMILKVVRNGLGSLIAGVDTLTRPPKKQRDPQVQAQVDAAAATMALYQFHACPFCIKVRRAMHKLNVPVPLKDAQKDPVLEQELIQKGGKRQVPCLRIQESDGSERWLYESNAIIQYLETRFGDQ